MDYILQVFKALANERRLKILELLLEKDKLLIEEIARKLKIPSTTCCRNLKILERVYLVNSGRKKEGTFYSLNLPKEHPYNKLIFQLIKLRKERRTKK
jgi:DNA-binding transcriptional ArsR family regulator